MARHKKDYTFHSAFANLEGGSRRLKDKSPGPASGYYVSRDPGVPVNKGGSLEGVVNKGDVKGIAKHFHTVRLDAQRAEPTQADEVYQGVWTDKKEGKTFLDVSDRVTRLDEALMRGIQNKQRAIYAAHDDKVLNVVDHDKDGNALGVRPAAKMTLDYQVAKRARDARYGDHA